MTRLLLMRHAKAERGSLHDDDHARRLAERGRRDAPIMGARLAAEGFIPDLVLSSDAARARETAELAAAAAGVAGAAVRFDPSLYLASAGHLLGVAVAAGMVGPGIGTIMIVAHNPGLEQLAGRLAGTNAAFPTAAIAACTFETDAWTGLEDVDVAARRATVRVFRPKDVGH